MGVEDFSTTPASNTAINGISVAEGWAPSVVNNAFRQLMAYVKQDLFNVRTDVASASSTDLGAAGSNYLRITGTTTITSFGTETSGVWKFVVFEDALTLTHNSTSLILPTGANITTAAGDCLIAESEGSGNWRVLVYQRKNGTPLAVASGSVVAASVDKTIITGQAQETSPATDDQVLLSDTSESSGALNRIALSDLLKVVNSLTEDSSPDTAADFLLSYDTSASAVKKVKPTNIVGSLVQVVSTQTGAVSTTTTIMPYDDSIPQNTEGAEFMTLAITPTSSTNKLLIEVVAYVSTSQSDSIGAVGAGALFQDTTAGALAAGYGMASASAFPQSVILISHIMDAGTTSETTFKFRAGPHVAGTLTFNGRFSGRIFGGVMASSIRITEYVP